MLADLQHGRMYSVQPVVRRSYADVPTRSGAGDNWDAAWIYEREIRQTAEPEAAANATRHVVAFLGLQPDQFNVRITRLSMPIRRRPAGQPQNGRPFGVVPQPAATITAGTSPSPGRL